MKRFSRVGRVRWFAIVVIVAAMLVSAIAVFAATTVIDSFGGGTQSLTANFGSTVVSSDASTVAAIGGIRNVQATYTVGDGDVRIYVNRNGTQPRLTLAIDPATRGRALVQWDGTNGMSLNPSGLPVGDRDFTGGGTNNSIVLRILNDDNVATITLRAYAFGSSADYRTFTYNLPGGITTGSAVDVVIPFSTFGSVGSGANFNNIGAFEMDIDATLDEGTDLILDFVEASGVRDYGDLPEGYPVTFSEDGARHVASGPRLGTNEDTEPDGVYSDDALHDDQYVGLVTGSPDDEDGVSATGQWTHLNGGRINVTVTGCTAPPCRLNGWVDFNKDLDFADTGEQILSDFAISNGATQLVTFAIPDTTTTVQGYNYARFRICSATGSCNTVTGEAPTGEVEDYRWNFNANAVTLSGLQAAQVSPVDKMMALVRSWLQQ